MFTHSLNHAILQLTFSMLMFEVSNLILAIYLSLSHLNPFKNLSHSIALFSNQFLEFYFHLFIFLLLRILKVCSNYYIDSEIRSTIHRLFQLFLATFADLPLRVFRGC